MFYVADQSEAETTADGGPRKIIIWKDRNRSVQLLNVYASFFSLTLQYCYIYKALKTK